MLALPTARCGSFADAAAGRGGWLGIAYCLGLGLPFILAALAFRRVVGAFGWVKRHYAWVTRIGGGLLVILGVLLVTGLWDDFANHLRV